MQLRAYKTSSTLWRLNIDIPESSLVALRNADLEDVQPENDFEGAVLALLKKIQTIPSNKFTLSTTTPTI